MHDYNQTKLKKIYSILSNEKEKYGSFKKSLLHLHTPASHDYRLLESLKANEYKKKTEEQLKALCVDKKAFPNFIEIESIDSKKLGFANNKEFFAYVLVANQLLVNGIEIAIVSDHNTTDGIEKLKLAINEVHTFHKEKKYPEILSGIEISCADKVHVVAVWNDKNESSIDFLSKWLVNNLYSVKEGVFRSSLDVMRELDKNGIFCYIAHINSSDILKEKFLSGAYKKELFESKHVDQIGVSNRDSISSIDSKMSEYRRNDINYLVDNDAHTIEEMDMKHMWIKCKKVTFQSFIDAITDYDVSVSFDQDNMPKQYIKGIYIENDLEGEEGFLVGKKKQAPFILSFSPSLNCFVGGRGAGKSSVLEVIQFVLAQKTDSLELLEFICKQDDAYILYNLNGIEYIIKMALPKKDDLDMNILNKYGINIKQQYDYKYEFDTKLLRAYILKNYLDIYKITKDQQSVTFKKSKEKEDLLRKMFNAKYSVNELVNIASGRKIDEFIYSLLVSNENLASLSGKVRFKTFSGLKLFSKNVFTMMHKQKDSIQELISKFNTIQKGGLRITYDQKNVYDEIWFSDFLFQENKNSDYIFKYQITKNNIFEYLNGIVQRVGSFEFLKLVLNMEIEATKYPIIDFNDDNQTRLRDTKCIAITKENQQNLITSILSAIQNSNCTQYFTKYYKEILFKIGEYSLEFDINSKVTSSRVGKNYKKITQLSLGQKVVAMLDFILAYSEYSRDFTPLVIDQPEDNLDSQYIYNNLVNQLRSVKQNRQVIVATHNSTIVTNAMAELVIVMISDGKNGRIDCQGYPGDVNIKKQIINYLEGGSESFKHKQVIYKPAL